MAFYIKAQQPNFILAKDMSKLEGIFAIVYVPTRKVETLSSLTDSRQLPR